MDAAFTVGNQVIVMFILIAVGVFCYKFGFITNRANKQLANVVITIVTPALLFVSYQKEFDKELAFGLIISLVIAVVSHFILIIFGMIFIKKKGNANCSVERFASAYSNCGYMGIPLIQVLYGTDGIFYLSAYITVFNILMWTHGIIMMREVKDFKSVVNAFKSPGVVAAVIGLLMFVFHIMLPEIILTPLNYIASLNTPLAMIVSGVTIAQTNVLKAFKKPRIYLVAALKLLIVPVIVLVIFKQFNINEAVLNTAVIAAACPCATATIMLAYKYNKNSIYASEIFAASTLLSAFTLPLVLVISGLI